MTTLTFEPQLINLSSRDYEIDIAKNFSLKKMGDMVALKLSLVLIVLTNMVLALAYGISWLIRQDMTALAFHVPLTFDCYEIQIRFYTNKVVMDCITRLLDYLICGTVGG